MSKLSGLSRLRLAQLLASCSGLDPYLAAYLLAWRMKPSEIALLLAARQATKFFLRMPASYFADRYSRKASMLIGVGGFAASMGLYGIASSWFEFLGASVLGGLGGNFFFGPDGALARALHREINPNDWKESHTEYVAKLGRQAALVEAAICVIATILESNLGIRAVITAQGAAYCVALALTLSLKEPSWLSKAIDNGRYANLGPLALLQAMSADGIPTNAALTCYLAETEPDFEPSKAEIAQLESLGLGGIGPDGQFRLTIVPAIPKRRTAPRRKRGSHFVVAPLFMYGLSRGFDWAVLKVRQERRRDGVVRFRVLEPRDLGAELITELTAALLIPTKGPARRLDVSDDWREPGYDPIEREERMRSWSLAMIGATIGAIMSLTAVTYRMGPLAATTYFNLSSVRIGGIWVAYLLAVLVLGAGHRRLGKLSLTKAACALGLLGLIGAGCYLILGLIGSVWSLTALLGLALIRGQESVFSTVFVNEYSSARNYSMVLSMLSTVQDGLAFVVLLGVSWILQSHSLGAAMVWVAAVHGVVAVITASALAYLQHIR
jgi:MFS family permease